jgi:hypothetical protein
MTEDGDDDDDDDDDDEVLRLSHWDDFVVMLFDELNWHYIIYFYCSKCWTSFGMKVKQISNREILQYLECLRLDF